MAQYIKIRGEDRFHRTVGRDVSLFITACRRQFHVSKLIRRVHLGLDPRFRPIELLPAEDGEMCDECLAAMTMQRMKIPTE